MLPDCGKADSFVFVTIYINYIFLSLKNVSHCDKLWLRRNLRKRVLHTKRHDRKKRELVPASWWTELAYFSHFNYVVRRVRRRLLLRKPRSAVH
jgi:hypothetical protein